jgi:hypothetical protein
MRPICRKKSPGPIPGRQSSLFYDQSGHEWSARVGAWSGLIAVDMPAILAVVWGGQEREIPGDTVRRDIDAHDARRAG